MSDDNDKNSKKDDEPFDFFRLSVDDDNNDEKKPKGRKPFPFLVVLAIVVGAVLLINMFFSSKPDDLVDFSKFRGLIESGRITRIVIGDPYYVGYGPESQAAVSAEGQKWSPFGFSSSDEDSGRPVYRTNGKWSEDFEKLLIEKGVEYKFESRQSGIFIQILFNLLPFILLFAIYFIAMRRLGAGMNSMGIFGGNGRSKAVDEGKVKTRFSDVAGVDEAKEELVEVVDFLKSPKKYTDIGGKIPKGVLLVGPPGTGKTLLARAVAGEAGVPFFRISGSDFVEMFVGVGASRVRDLFRTAREKAPCIIFIDELDAIGKSRMNNLGGNDEREQTLNQLLVEMDGFDNEKGLIILAATNRPDILDPALLRPGRFDRQVSVDKPDVKGREAILRIHSKNVKLDPSVDFDSLAHATAGFSGADLANIVNEAALLAVRGGRKQVTMPDFDEAIEKTVVGLEKKTRVMSEEERKSVAIHETGHALVTVFTKNTSPVHKISIIPRGMGALGYTMQRSEEEKFLNTEKDLINDIDILLGGRAAEQICLGVVDTGAANDIQRATGIIRSMITQYGMSKKFYNVTLGKSGRGYASGEPELVREYSEETQKYIDDELARMMAERYKHVMALLTKHKDLLLYISDQLLEKETMTGKEFEEFVKDEANCVKAMKQKKASASKEKAPAKEKPASSEKPAAKKRAGRPRKTSEA